MRWLLIFPVAFLVPVLSSGQQKTITVDFASPLEQIKDLGGVNGGPETSLTEPSSVAGYHSGGVTGVRIHDVAGLQYFEYAPTFWVNKKLNVNFNPALETSYKWITADQKIDSLIIWGFEPYFRIGINFDAARDVYSAAPVDPDGYHFSKFSELAKRTVLHFNQGWANGKTYGLKFWEIWNEPDGGFWKDSVNSPSSKPGDSVAFARMYKEVTDSMLKADPGILVGGPGVLSGSVVSKRKWLTTFLTECSKNNARLDFFSWHLYGALNPYAIAIQGDYIRGLLDGLGFQGTESHVSEHNIRLGSADANSAKPLINTPKHGAFTASSMISAQFGKIDKLLFYKGKSFMNLFKPDSLGLPSLTLSGQGFTAFTELSRFTPQRVKADSSEFIQSETSTMRDTTNLMILAGRSEDLNACYVLISNYNSKYKSCPVTIKNLPWTQPGKVELRITKMNAQGTVTESTQSVSPESVLSITVDEMQAPAFALCRFTYKTETGIGERNGEINSFYLNQNFPNPFNPTTKISFSMVDKGFITLKIYSVTGNELETLISGEFLPGQHEASFDGSKYSSGLYFYELVSGHSRQVRKMVLLK